MARSFSFSTFYILLSAFFLCSCANHHFQVPAEGPPGDAPHYVDLLEARQVATLHFPAGFYSFYAMDDRGYYYRAPRQILQHTGGSTVPRKGGIYVTRASPRKLRGYVYLGGSLTHVGDLTHTPHQFRD
jgi:hypothetical protein